MKLDVLHQSGLSRSVLRNAGQFMAAPGFSNQAGVLKFLLSILNLGEDKYLISRALPSPGVYLKCLFFVNYRLKNTPLERICQIAISGSNASWLSLYITSRRGHPMANYGCTVSFPHESANLKGGIIGPISIRLCTFKTPLQSPGAGAKIR